MDGVQRNFNMMAEKIDRMRCLRERCDSYVRLIKLTLDETIREQNSLLDGSAIHNRLKHIKVNNIRPTASSNDYAFSNNNNIKYDKNTDYKYSLFDNCSLGIGPHKKKTNVNSTDTSYLQPSYNSGYKPPKSHTFPSTAVAYPDNQCDDSYYLPISSKNDGTSVNIRTNYPRGYQVYYFPTSKPIPQYPRQTTERFYRRNPVKQYPVEQVPYWYTRYIKPVRVVEREPYYRTVDYDICSGTNQDYFVDDKYIEPYTHYDKYRPRYYPTNDCSKYRGLDDGSYYYEPNVQRQRSFSSITRPCSPVYSWGNDISVNRTHRFENSGSLLEKKIQDYVWNPHKELHRVDKYTIPNYEKNTYFASFKPSSLQNNYHREANDTTRTRLSFELDPPQTLNQINEVTKLDSSYCKKPSTLQQMSPEKNRRSSFQSRKDDNNHIDHISKNTSYNKKTEMPVHFPKRISFDLENENIELSNRKNSIPEINTVQHVNTVERKSNLMRRESNPSKHDDNRRPSILLNDDYNSISISKSHILPSHTNGNSRREFSNRPEKKDVIGNNSRESDKNVLFNDNLTQNNLNSLEKNIIDYNVTNDDVERDNYVQKNDTTFYPKRQYDKNSDVRNGLSNEKMQNEIKRDIDFVGNNNEKRRLTESTGKSNFNNEDRVKYTSNKKDDIKILERRESYKDEQKYKKEDISDGKNKYINTTEKVDNDYQNIINDSSKNIIIPFAVSNNGDANSYSTSEEKITDREQVNNIDNHNVIDNGINSEAIQPYQEIKNFNEETGNINSPEQNGFDYESNVKLQEPSQGIIANNDEYGNDTTNNYYQDHSFNNDINAVRSINEAASELQPEYADGRNKENYDYPADGFAADNKKENVTSSEHHVVEPIQHNDLVDENIHDELYYKNRRAAEGDTKEKPTRNQYDPTPAASDPQEKFADELPGNDNDYYYKNNYSNADESNGRPDNQYPAESDNHQSDYDATTERDAEYDKNNYYDNNYQHRAGVDDAEKRQADNDRQYVSTDPNNYQENYADQQQHQPGDEYYYQNADNNYSDADGIKEQPENLYAEPVREYVQDDTTDVQHNDDDYYYANDAEKAGNTNGNLIDQHYVGPEYRENYIGQAQDNNSYYYENNNSNDANAADSIPPAAQYDEHHHGQQESYADNRNADDGYYYQKPNDDGVYDESIPKEQLYGGYDVGNDQHRTDVDASYYPDPQTHRDNNNYDAQPADYDNNDYQTHQQSAEYIEPLSYEQDPNENYDYTPADGTVIDGGQPRDHISDDLQQNNSIQES